MSSLAICSLRAQLSSANKWLDEERAKVANRDAGMTRLEAENKGLREMANMWKEFHDQNVSMQHAFDEARKRMRS